jgi:hypothetical protein
MFGTIFNKVTGLLDQRFVLGLVMPVLAFLSGVAALVATRRGWTATLAWWAHLGGSRQALLAVAFAVAVVFAAIVLGTQVIALTRLLEGYWGSGLPGRIISRPFLWHERRRLGQLEMSKTPVAGLRLYQEFAPGGQLQPTRLGNVLRAMESYPGDEARWGLDAVFWWPRLYLMLPDATREQVDTARATMDQMVVVIWLLMLFSLVAAGFGAAGVSLSVWLPCTIGSFVMARISYTAAVGAGISFGELVRSCFDLYRKSVLDGLGWETPLRWPDERELWQALQQRLYRGDDSALLLNEPRTTGTTGSASGSEGVVSRLIRAFKGESTT